MSKVAVASCGPRENSSAGLGARSTYCRRDACHEAVPRQVLDDAHARALRREAQVPRRRRADEARIGEGVGNRRRRHARKIDALDAAGDLRPGRGTELELVEDVAGDTGVLVGIEQSVDRARRIVRARPGEPLVSRLNADRDGYACEVRPERRELHLDAALLLLVGEGLAYAVGRGIARRREADLVVLVVGRAEPIAHRVDRGMLRPELALARDLGLLRVNAGAGDFALGSRDAVEAVVLRHREAGIAARRRNTSRRRTRRSRGRRNWAAGR